jgi:hypothetical protein
LNKSTKTFVLGVVVGVAVYHVYMNMQANTAGNA